MWPSMVRWSWKLYCPGGRLGYVSHRTKKKTNRLAHATQTWPPRLPIWAHTFKGQGYLLLKMQSCGTVKSPPRLLPAVLASLETRWRIADIKRVLLCELYLHYCPQLVCTDTVADEHTPAHNKLDTSERRERKRVLHLSHAATQGQTRADTSSSSQNKYILPTTI